MKITRPTKPLISIKEEVKNLNFWKDTFAKSKQQKSQKKIHLTQTGFNRFQVRNLNVKSYEKYHNGEDHDGSNLFDWINNCSTLMLVHAVVQ